MRFGDPLGAKVYKEAANAASRGRPLPGRPQGQKTPGEAPRWKKAPNSVNAISRKKAWLETPGRRPLSPRRRRRTRNQPYGCLKACWLMELVTDDEGGVAPRPEDRVMDAEQR